jgi:prevent-host-death family protein
MISRVSVAQAKQHLADLLGRVAYGKERVTITRRGRPMAVLVPPEQVFGKRRLADARGWLDERDSFFTAIGEIIEGRLRHRPRVLR